MLSKESIKQLLSGKNLLAFSAGVDSSALFFILIEHNINFDIAIVNYNLREQAKEEVAYAKELAKKYNKKIYTASAPVFNKNFEANAREFRYTFFKQIIKENAYCNLLTAHHLNDKLEWLLMRLSKGAGVSTLSGMQVVEQKEYYTSVRPLLEYTKEELLNYLEKNKIKHFVDKSNFNTKYERNKFRPLANTLLKEGKDGFLRSFNLLQNESSLIKNGYELQDIEQNFRAIKLASREHAPYALNLYLKELGYLVSYKEQLAIKTQESIVVGRKWAIELSNNTLYIAPYIKVVMPKEVKEHYRKLKIPPKIRGYLYSINYKLS